MFFLVFIPSDLYFFTISLLIFSLLLFSFFKFLFTFFIFTFIISSFFISIMLPLTFFLFIITLASKFCYDFLCLLISLFSTFIMHIFFFPTVFQLPVFFFISPNFITFIWVFFSKQTLQDLLQTLAIEDLKETAMSFFYYYVPSSWFMIYWEH